jgi:plasmid rolling circle replication initiator protein Rep
METPIKFFESDELVVYIEPPDCCFPSDVDVLGMQRWQLDIPSEVFFSDLQTSFSKLCDVFWDSVDYIKNGLTGCKPPFLIPFKEFTSVPEDKSLSRLSPKDKIWDKHRASSDLIKESYKRSGYDRYAERIDKCSNFLEFAKVESDKEFLIKLTNSHFCRHRHCVVCQWRKTLKWSARFWEAMPKILEDYPTHRFIFLTLTLKNCDVSELRDTIDLMNQAWKRLIELKAFPAEGFIKSLEVTKSKEGLAHPHFHILMIVPSGYFSKPGGYLSHERWMHLWRKCLRINYDPVVDVKAVKQKSDQSVFKALNETLKYSVKPEDLMIDTAGLTSTQVLDNDTWLLELTKQLHRTKAVSLGGIFKKYLSDDEPDDLININENGDDLPVTNETLLFQWRSKLKQYMLHKHIE